MREQQPIVIDSTTVAVLLSMDTLCRRKQREAKKFGKQVAAEVRKDRAANKKSAVDSISRLRKVTCHSFQSGLVTAQMAAMRLSSPLDQNSICPADHG